MNINVIDFASLDLFFGPVFELDPDANFYTRNHRIYLVFNLYWKDIHLLCKDSCLDWPDFTELDVNFYGIEDYTVNDAWIPWTRLSEDQFKELEQSSGTIMFRRTIS